MSHWSTSAMITFMLNRNEKSPKFGSAGSVARRVAVTCALVAGLAAFSAATANAADDTSSATSQAWRWG